ncbi:MAG: hypothetical protein NTW59_02915, partial [Candidatus Diapherotrites archaeon]|nr:hypothetical protein [Candidatus Diapherotrites archaeon]
KQILEKLKIIIVPEPGFGGVESSLLSEEKGTCAVLWDAPRVPLSSTAVREKLEKGKDAGELVGAKVLDYIKKNGLYKQKK